MSHVLFENDVPPYSDILLGTFFKNIVLSPKISFSFIYIFTLVGHF